MMKNDRKHQAAADARGWLDAEPRNSKEPVGISVPAHDWTVAQMINFIRLL